MADINNLLGLDKFQLTIIRGNYASMKPSIAKRDKALQKIEETTKKFQDKLEAAVASLRQEAAAYNEQIATLDKFTLDTTEKTCGNRLTTQQVIDFIDHPEKFEECRQSIGMLNTHLPETEAESAETQDEEPYYNENCGE